MAIKIARLQQSSSTKKKAFVSAVLFAAAMNIFDAFWRFGMTRTWNIPEPLLQVLNALYFLAYGLSAFCWLIFSETVHNKEFYKCKQALFFSSLPLAALLVMSVTSVFTGCFFYFDEAGQYHRGSLFYFQYILSFGYVLIASVKNALCVIADIGDPKKNDYSVMFSFVIPPVACLVLQCFLQDLPILSIAPTLSFLLVYTNTIQSQITIDSLTGINNRRKLMIEMSGKIRGLSKNRRLYFLFLDVNAFKNINDTYGHFEGDRVLQLVAAALRSVCEKTGGIPARYGGDEFAVLQELGAEEDIDEVKHMLEARVSDMSLAGDYPCHVTVSVGYAEFDRNTDDIRSLIIRADRYMYQNKAKKKKGHMSPEA